MDFSKTGLRLVSLVAALILAGCSSAAPPAARAIRTSSPAAQGIRASSPASSPAVTDPASSLAVTDPAGASCAALDDAGYCPGDDPQPALTCGTVIDSTGWAGGPLTETRAIAILSDFVTVRGIAITGGTLTDREQNTLAGLALDMENYAGGQLASDAGAYASDWQTYAANPDGSYGDTVIKDIIVLVKDCPAAYRLGQQMLAGGGGL